MSYDDHVAEALDEVRSKQHLRYINRLYKTKEVCLEAVKFESTHTLKLNDFYSVPMGNLDYVMHHMKEFQKDNKEYLKILDEAYHERKKSEQEPGFHGKYNTFQDILDHHKATDHDDMCRKIFNK